TTNQTRPGPRYLTPTRRGQAVSSSASAPGASGGLLLGSENTVDCLFALDATADGPHGPAEGEELLARKGVHEVRKNAVDMRRSRLDDRGQACVGQHQLDPSPIR